MRLPISLQFPRRHKRLIRFPNPSYSLNPLYHLLLLAPFLQHTIAVVTDSNAPLILPTYHLGDPVPVTCLARTIETGEHILQDSTTGALKYIPFPTCSETGRPLTISFLEETDNKTCTIESVDDELFHLLEFYLHADSPLSCRVPGRPVGLDRYLTPQAALAAAAAGEGKRTEKGGSSSSSSRTGTGIGGGSDDVEQWIPLVINLAGKIELSHIHLSPTINLLFHLDPSSTSFSSSSSSSSSSLPPSFAAISATAGAINSATAYSINPNSKLTKLNIGSPLKLSFSIRWFPSQQLPKSNQVRWNPRDGSHITIHTFLYCLITAIGTAAVCAVYFRGWEMPKRLRRFDIDRLGGSGTYSGFAGGSGVLGGYGVGYGGYGYSNRGGTPGAGKKD